MAPGYYESFGYRYTLLLYDMVIVGYVFNKKIGSWRSITLVPEES